MPHHSNPFYDKVLARVKDPARRRAMANLYDDTDRLLTEQLVSEAKERDKERAKAAKAKTKVRKAA